MYDFTNHPEFQFHHIGVATYNIHADIEFFSYFGYSVEGSCFIDDNQGVQGCFLSGGGPRIELISDTSGQTTVSGFLKKGIKVYHLAYLVTNLSTVSELVSSLRGFVVRNPMTSVAFEGRSVMFVMFRGNVLIEFIGYDDATNSEGSK